MHIHKTAAVPGWLPRFALASVVTMAGNQVEAQVDGSVSIVSDYRFRGASLSNGHPEPQVQLGYDGKGGWYVGGFASGVNLKREKTSHTQLLAYAGFSQRQTSGISLEAGAIKTIFLRAADYGYLEEFAGFATDNIRGRLYFSSDYFGEHVRTLYAEFNYSHPIWRRLQFIGHIGYLHVFPNAEKFAAYQANRPDISLGVSAAFPECSIQLSWIAGKQNSDVSPFYKKSTESPAWVLNASVPF
jgi:uncharacterized protein (TIGR02001 family)